MAVKEALLPEFDHEMGTTRRLLERVPEEDMAWKPHEKSFSLGQLAAHLANIPTWVVPTCDLTVFDLASLGEDLRTRQPSSKADVMSAFDVNVAKARKTIVDQTDASLAVMWTIEEPGRGRLHDAENRRVAQLRDEPFDSPSRSADGLPAGFATCRCRRFTDRPPMKADRGAPPARARR